MEFRSINSGNDETKSMKVDEQSVKKRLAAPRDFSNKDENIKSLLKTENNDGNQYGHLSSFLQNQITRGVK